MELDLKPDQKKLQQFGFFALVGFALLAFLVHHQFGHDGPISQGFIALFLALAIFCPLAVLINPKLVQPIWVVMIIIAFPIGFVISHLVMSLVFFGLITPIALFFKLKGRDAMNRSWDASATTYWEKRGEPRPARDYFRQF
jgi:hypothetical protein